MRVDGDRLVSKGKASLTLNRKGVVPVGMRSVALVVVVLMSACSSTKIQGKDTQVESPQTLDKKAQVLDEKSLGQEVLAMIRTAKCSDIWERFSDTMKGVIGSETAFVPSCKTLSASIAGAQLVAEESSNYQQKGELYIARLKPQSGVVLRVTIAVSGSGTIDGLRISPDDPSKPAPSQYTSYKTKSPLRLPFTSTWTVYWGGRSVEKNYHVAYPSQHFAYDLVVTKGGLTYKNEGKANSDYYCFGQQIVAAGAGTVIEVIGGVKDNVPGQMNGEQVTGNHVIVDHGEGEYALYAHLQHESTKVVTGQVVVQGEEIGRCGNSGNSSEAHLHFHLQDKPKFGEGESMPAQFLNYYADDERIERGEPSKGQSIRTGDQVSSK